MWASNRNMIGCRYYRIKRSIGHLVTSQVFFLMSKCIFIYNYCDTNNTDKLCITINNGQSIMYAISWINGTCNWKRSNYILNKVPMTGQK